MGGMDWALRHANKVLWALMGLTAPVLYLLLLGPLIGLTSRGLLPGWVYRGAVYPLYFLGIDGNDTALGNAITEYLRLWLPP